jgi:hypothetical protein
MNFRSVLGISKLIFTLIVVAVTATGAVGAYMAFQGPGGGTLQTTTSTTEGGNYFTLELSCGKGEISEVYEAYSKSRNFCWGWLGTHTYALGAGIRIERVSGEVRVGPSEGGRSGKLYIETKKSGGEWNTLKSMSVSAGTSINFSVDVQDTVTAIRLRVSPPPEEKAWISIDSSNIRFRIPISVDEVIHHDCHEGVHEEAQKAKETTGDNCWGWLSTHTYDLGRNRRVDLVVAITKLGPSVFSGDRGDIRVEVSMDGKNWVKIYEGTGFIGGPLSVAATSTNGVEARYVRVRSGSGNYIDFSDIYIAAEP